MLQVAFRGTSSPGDLLVDAQILQTPWQKKRTNDKVRDCLSSFPHVNWKYNNGFFVRFGLALFTAIKINVVFLFLRISSNLSCPSVMSQPRTHIIIIITTTQIDHYKGARRRAHGPRGLPRSVRFHQPKAQGAGPSGRGRRIERMGPADHGPFFGGSAGHIVYNRFGGEYFTRTICFDSLDSIFTPYVYFHHNYKYLDLFHFFV